MRTNRYIVEPVKRPAEPRRKFFVVVNQAQDEEIVTAVFRNPLEAQITATKLQARHGGQP